MSLAMYFFLNVRNQWTTMESTTSHNKTNEVAPKDIPNNPISNQEDAETWSSDQNEVLVVYNILLV